MRSARPLEDDARQQGERQVLLSRLLAAVRGCQARYGVDRSRGELATDRDDCREVLELLQALEDIMWHGLKRREAEGAVDRVRELLPASLSFGSSAPLPPSSPWPFLKTLLNKHELERFYLLRRVTSDVGRCRAWMRAALNEHSLERYILAMIGDAGAMERFYEPWAFLRDRQRGSMLPSAAAGMGSVTFALRIDVDDLNVVKEEGDASGEKEDLGDEVAVEEKKSSSGNKKKKRKAASSVISFDQEDDSDGRRSQRSSAPSSPRNERRSGAASNELERQILISKTMSKAPAVSSSGSHREGRPQSRDRSAILDFDEKVRLRPGEGSSSSRKVLDSEEEDDGKSLQSVESEQDESAGGGLDRRRLTPLKNLSVGGLIPMRSGGGGQGASEQDVNSEDSLSMSESDYASALGATPAASKAGSIFGSSKTGGGMNRARDPRHIHPAGPAAVAAAGSSVHSSSGISREDLKQALLSVMERKDELQGQCSNLKRLLSQESESASLLREEVSAERRKGEESKEKLQSRIQALSRENELLKHQLKKYVGAVQKLRDGPQAYETLAQLEQSEDGGRDGRGSAPRYVDYHFEASEYEKKLIQVAEMHGELIEFNEHLQKVLQAKDAAMRRMREELVELRGPLPNEDDEDEVRSAAEAVESASLASDVESNASSSRWGRSHVLYCTSNI